MRIVFITNYPFPYGMAQTNRIIAMARGLLYAGADVEVVVSKATEIGKPVNTEVTGAFQGIRFTYAAGKTVRPPGTFKRALLFSRGQVRTLHYLIRENRKGKVNVLFMGVHSNRMTYVIYLLTRILHIKFVQERSEYPFLSCSGSLTGKVKLGIYLKFICGKFDGFIVISRALAAYFKPYLKAGIEPFLLPILVEPERFCMKQQVMKDLVSYCGSMQGNKDGVPILIDAFSRIARAFPAIKLRLIGSTDFPDFKEIQKRIKELNLEGRIEFTGSVGREEMPSLLLESKVLALARPESKQAEGGFPTKLGEYLATGRITVVTSVGEIPRYLTHKRHALLAKPGSVEDFVKKLTEALSDDRVNEIMAKEGKKLADELFNYKVQGKKLYHWLISLVET